MISLVTLVHVYNFSCTSACNYWIFYILDYPVRMTGCKSTLPCKVDTVSVSDLAKVARSELGYKSSNSSAMSINATQGNLKMVVQCVITNTYIDGAMVRVATRAAESAVMLASSKTLGYSVDVTDKSKAAALSLGYSKEIPWGLYSSAWSYKKACRGPAPTDAIGGGWLCDPQVALLLLRLCGSFCRLVHLARSTPPSLIVDGLALFDNDVRHCFAECTMVDTSDAAWQQAQLSLSRGGLGLHRLSLHSPAAYIASVVASDCSSPQSKHLLHAIDLFNASVPTTDELTITSITTSNLTQKLLSAKLEDQQFTKLFANASLPDRARLLSISSPHSSAWLSVTPSPRLNLHLDPSEFQVAIKWWLGLPVSQGQLCPQCMSHSLDQYGHHVLSCKNGPDVVSRHNRVRDTLFEFCQRACLGAQLEAGSSLGHEARQTRPADVLIPNWELGKPAAIDLCVTSPLNSNTLQVACVTPNSAAMQAEQRKHHSNDAKCEELGWVCIPLVVESYGSWGPEAQRCLSRLAGRLATQLGQPKSLTTNMIYGRLNLTLIRANSRAILSRLYV
eukprot:Em0016g718a